MFQPALKAFDGAGFGVAAPVGARGGVNANGPYSLAPLQGRGARGFAIELADLDLAVDLGDAVGSKTWWRGLATLALLVGVTARVGLTVPTLPETAPPALLPQQVELAQAATIAPLALGGDTGGHIGPTALVRPLAETPERPRIEVVATLRAVDSVGGALRRAGIGSGEVATIVSLIENEVSLNKLKPGTAFDLVLGRRASKSVPRPLEHLAFRAAFDLKLEVGRSNPAANLALKRIPIAVDNTPLRVTGTVGSSLYKAARASGLPARAVADAIKALGYKLDIQRDIQGRDRFDIVVAHRRAATGETETGELLYVGLAGGKKDVGLMRWGSGKSQFFLADGSSAKKGLMRTPVDGARLTSGFGFRTHPILGYSRLHKGVDFGAGHGTPVMAAAAGTVNFAGRHGGHGNYVRIAHGNKLQTAYAHLSRFAVKNGTRVDQGQVIGYVGSTGMSTGPHLHYELYVGGKAVDPRSIKFTGGMQLAGAELSRFKSELARLRGLKPVGAEPEVVASREEPGKQG